MLLVALTYADTRDLVPAETSGSPAHCEELDQLGLCGVFVNLNSTGVQAVNFTFTAPSVPQTLNLRAIAVLASGQNFANLTVIDSSRSRQSFSIDVTDMVGLQVLAPEQVTVNLDGVPQTPGILETRVQVGNHTISVPDSVQTAQATRLKFVRWSDGNNQTQRTIFLTEDSTLEAVYNLQYELTVSSAYAPVQGAGWYDVNSTASFSVSASEVAMEGVLGAVGGKMIFQGWSESGHLAVSSINGTVFMDRPHVFVAEWTADYTSPLLIVALVAVIAIAVGAFTLRKRKAARRKPYVAQRFCKNCGTRVRVGVKFCTKCGRRLT